MRMVFRDTSANCNQTILQADIHYSNFGFSWASVVFASSTLRDCLILNLCEARDRQNVAVVPSRCPCFCLRHEWCNTKAHGRGCEHFKTFSGWLNFPFIFNIAFCFVNKVCLDQGNQNQLCLFIDNFEHSSNS